MRIELTREVRRNGDLWYVIRIDGMHDESFRTELQAREAFNRLKAKAQLEETKEVLEVFETNNNPHNFEEPFG